MAKPRILDDSFWAIPRYGQLTIPQRLLLAGMITRCADDEGRLLADPEYLRVQLFGYDRELQAHQVGYWRDALCWCLPGEVLLYEVAGVQYIWLSFFQEQQKIRYKVKSRHPAWDQSLEVDLRHISETFGNLPKITAEPEASSTPGGGHSRKLRKVSENYGLSSSSVGMGSEGLSSSSRVRKNAETFRNSSNTAADGDDDFDKLPLAPQLRGKEAAQPVVSTVPTTLAEAEVAGWAVSDSDLADARSKGWNTWVDLDAQTEAFRDYYLEGKGKHTTHQSWPLAWRNWVRRNVQSAMQKGVPINGSKEGRGPTASKQVIIRGEDTTGATGQGKPGQSLRDLLA